MKIEVTIGEDCRRGPWMARTCQVHPFVSFASSIWFGTSTPTAVIFNLYFLYQAINLSTYLTPEYLISFERMPR